MSHAHGLEALIDAYCRRPHALMLRGAVQHYDWGGVDYIPSLLGLENADGRPFAELWIGAHPDNPSRALLKGHEIALDRLIRACASRALGAETVGRFGDELPYLMKVLSARHPLSIQAHPSQQQAQQGFERENREGKSPQHPSRNYHDPHHKPELIAALTDFYALSGFRPLAEIGAILASIPEFARFCDSYVGTRDSLQALYREVMTLPQSEVDAVLGPLMERLADRNRVKPFTKAEPAYWALEADRIFSRSGRRDRGLFSIFLLNLVHLPPGEALFMRSGKLHAYLEGTGIEVMAGSNNVLRGGLTSKHVDVDELLRVLRFSCKPPAVILPESLPETMPWETYRSPAREFELSTLRLHSDTGWQSARQHGVHTGVVIRGGLRLGDDTGEDLVLGKGDGFLVPDGVGYRLATDSETTVFMSRVPRADSQRRASA
jgi:mannose-6-phosphate isomerase class I